jgi:hypothetical protein
MARTRAWSHRFASSARRAVNPLLNVGVPGTVLLIPGQDILAFLLEDPMKRKLLYITLLFIAVMLVTFIFVIREPFENQEADPATDLQQIMTFFSETLCPVYKVIVDDIKRHRPSGSEVFRLLGDHSKATSMTGYKPKVNLESGLKQTIDWFTNSQNLSLYKTNIYNV